MIRRANKRTAALTVISFAGLIGCGIWAWTGTYSYSDSFTQIVTTLSQPNPVAVTLDMNMAFSQLGHATCKFQVTACPATVNIGTDSWNAPSCTFLCTESCIGFNAGDTFASAVSGTMTAATGTTVDTYDLTITNFAGGGPVTIPLT